MKKILFVIVLLILPITVFAESKEDVSIACSPNIVLVESNFSCKITAFVNNFGSFQANVVIPNNIVIESVDVDKNKFQVSDISDNVLAINIRENIDSLTGEIEIAKLNFKVNAGTSLGENKIILDHISVYENKNSNYVEKKDIVGVLETSIIIEDFFVDSLSYDEFLGDEYIGSNDLDNIVNPPTGGMIVVLVLFILLFSIFMIRYFLKKMVY